MFHRIEHTALSVSDLERSLAFYRDVIGMSVDLTVEFTDDTLGTINGIAKSKARVVHLKLGETVLELFEYGEPKGRPAASCLRQCDVGFTHIGFRVTGIHGECERLKAQGVRFFSDPVELRPGAFVVYFEGPDKEVCEMRQVPV